MSVGFTVIVPCHRHSRRLPEKLSLDVGGKPVMQRTLEQAMKSTAVRVVAALSDPSLAPIAEQAGAEHLMTETHTSGTSRAAETASLCRLDDEAMVVVVQADEPFIDPDTIDAVAHTLADSPDVHCATAARPAGEHEYVDPNAVKVVVDSRSMARHFSRAPIPHNRDKPGAVPPGTLIHHGIYAYRVSFLHEYTGLQPAPDEEIEKLEQLRILWHGRSMAVAVTQDQSFGIDTMADLERARTRFKRQS